jgi:hypothetical protein
MCEETITIDGVTIEKGCSVQIPIWVIHYNPEYYPDPEKFDPERYLDWEGDNFIKIVMSQIFSRRTYATQSAHVSPVWFRPAQLYRHAFCSIRAAHGNRAYYSSNSTAADK